MSQAEVNRFLDNPRTIMGVRFVCSVPDEEDEDLMGQWSILSHLTRVDPGRGIDDEFQVQLEAFSDGPVAMGRDEVEYLLAYSRMAS